MPDLKILIADDHAPVRRNIRSLLESHNGWTVAAEVSNGRDAIREARRLKPNVAVLDFSMPEVDGLQATREILKEDPEICVLILTVHASDAIASEAWRAGAKRVLPKSTAPETLISTIESLVRAPMLLAGKAINRWYHIGAFFHSANVRDRVLSEFAAEGLACGDRVVQIIDHDHQEERAASGAFVVAPGEVYRQLDIAAMTARLEMLMHGESTGPSFSRVIGYARPNEPLIIEFEARLNDLLRAFDAVTICVYDVPQYDSRIILDAFRAHPAVLIDNDFHENPFYVPPEIMLRELGQRH